jgi:hypothetical protein
VIALGCSAIAQAPTPKSSNESLRVFAVSSGSKADFGKLRAVLQEQTDVPVRLPAFLPYIDATNPVAASLVSIASSSYEIALGWGEDCFSPDLLGGAGACHYGTIRGSAERLIGNEGPRVPLVLVGRRHGYFVSSTCGSHCDDAAIGWQESGYHYSISMKAESEKVLIKVANSAISQQHDKVLARK